MRPMPWVPCPEGSFRRATLTLSCLNIVLRSKGSGPKALKRKREGARERERDIYIYMYTCFSNKQPFPQIIDIFGKF